VLQLTARTADSIRFRIVDMLGTQSVTLNLAR
jgi:hypothetical protein